MNEFREELNKRLVRLKVLQEIKEICKGVEDCDDCVFSTQGNLSKCVFDFSVYFWDLDKLEERWMKIEENE